MSIDVYNVFDCTLIPTVVPNLFNKVGKKVRSVTLMLTLVSKITRQVGHMSKAKTVRNMTLKVSCKRFIGETYDKRKVKNVKLCSKLSQHNYQDVLKIYHKLRENSPRGDTMIAKYYL